MHLGSVASVPYLPFTILSVIKFNRLNLCVLGITCLQLAAKNEEIYPPKMAEYAYVTDGACSEMEIIAKELVICEVGAECSPDVRCRSLFDICV